MEICKREIVPDTEIQVHSEKSLDDKLKPEAVWTKSFVFDPIRREVLSAEGELKDGFLKIKKIKEIQGGHYGADIPVLLYVNANYRQTIKSWMEKHGYDTENKEELIKHFFASTGFREDWKYFYKCEKCNGYIEGFIESEPHDDIGGLAGWAGTRYFCGRCGTTIDERVIAQG